MRFKPLNQRAGKHYIKWNQVRRQFIQDNPPTHEGYFFCSNCYRALTIDEVTVDHIIPRSARPDLRYDPENLQYMCGPCNVKKGSQH